MSKFLTLSLVILMISISGAQSDDSLMHRSHEKLKQAQQEMEIIKKTDDPVEKEKLLDQHMETMQEFNAMMLQIQEDPQRGSEGQGTAMADIMVERVRYLEHMMKQLIDNQNERLNLKK
tara:strand:- start:32589 stop:32945 length:357 start_codon:yes stop_codon:yes gene_type:complete